MSLAKFVKIVEVGPRDGLQNEKKPIDTAQKIELIQGLAAAGLKTIEATSFVSPKKIPQLADAAEVYQHIHKPAHIDFPVLIPNLQGLNNALQAGVKSIAVFTSVSERFSQNNVNCSITQSLERIKKIIHKAKQEHLIIRGYISCVWGCPYEGSIDFKHTATLTKQLLAWGCSEVSLGDTIGVATPKQVSAALHCLSNSGIDIQNLAVHFHDTYGQAIANIYTALQQGVSTVDSSIAGLGGCPYAKGATGNVATEDVLYLLEGLGINTGINFAKLLQVSAFVEQKLKLTNRSKAARALLRGTG